MDKRYESIYQRGHAGQPSAAEPSAAGTRTGTSGTGGLSRTEPASAGERSTDAEAVRRVAAGPHHTGSPTEHPAVEVAPLGPDGRALPKGAPAPVPARLPANPYLRLLVILGAVLVAVGAVALFWGGQLMSLRILPTGVEDQNQAVLMFTYGQALITLGPFLLALGIGTLIGVLFLSAANWRRRHQQPPYK